MIVNDINALTSDKDEDIDRDVSQLREVIAAKHASQAQPAPEDFGAKINKIRDVLKVNMEYQAFLRSQIERLSSQLYLNNEKQRVARQILDRLAPATKKTPVLRKTIYNAAHFMDNDGSVPPDNRDAIQKRELRKGYPTSSGQWAKEESANLEMGLFFQNYQILVRHLYTVLPNVPPKAIDGEARKVMKAFPHLKYNTEGIDWNALASSHVASKSGIDCKIQWFGALDPQINIKPWTKEEDKKLVVLAKQYEGRNWIEISSRLASGRTPLQCFARFQRSANPSVIRSEFTEEEDQRLCELIWKYGEKNWALVASLMKGHTDNQCLHRWRALNPTGVPMKKGTWSSVEDMRLRLSVACYGPKSWFRIRCHVPGRSEYQCRERWANVLKPGLIRGEWTQAEDAKLLAAVAKYDFAKIPWAKVALELAPRTDSQCVHRWKRLKNKESEEGSAQVKTRRKIRQVSKEKMVRNFTGRRKERTTLTATDMMEIDPDKGSDNGEGEEQTLEGEAKETEEKKKAPTRRRSRKKSAKSTKTASATSQKRKRASRSAVRSTSVIEQKDATVRTQETAPSFSSSSSSSTSLMFPSSFSLASVSTAGSSLSSSSSLPRPPLVLRLPPRAPDPPIPSSFPTSSVMSAPLPLPPLAYLPIASSSSSSTV